MAGRDQRRDRLNTAGSKLVEQLLADDEFVAYISETEIERQVAAGLLVRADSLRVGPGLELHPIGLVATLQARLLELASHPTVEQIDLIADLRAECVTLAGGPPSQPSADTSAPAPPAAESTPPQPDGEPQVPVEDQDRRPPGMPSGPAPCDECGVDVDEAQAMRSWIRWRRPLCLPHHKAEKPKKTAA